MIDFANSNEFSVTQLTDAINKLPPQPTKIGKMDLFRTEGIRTTAVTIEEKDGVLSLLPTKRRGEPGTIAKRGERRIRTIATLHIPYDDTILPQDIQNVRSFGTENELEAVGQVIISKLAEMKSSHEVTLEYHRLGAVKGVILDADGSTVIYDLFDEFGVEEQEVDFLLDTSTTDVLSKCLDVIRKIETCLGGLVYDHIHCFCGRSFFTKLTGHTNVKDAFKYQQSQVLRSDNRNAFTFGGITFEEYSGGVGNVQFINTNEARFFPVGVPGLFKTYFAPANMIDAANTVGLPYYASIEKMKHGQGYEIHTESNPLCLCLRPRCLVKGNVNS